jgi:PhnB protein
MLSVRRGSEAVAFYKSAFGARELFKIEGDGSVVAELEVQGAKFWVADESPPHQNFSPETLGGATTRFVLVVEDPNAFHAKALAAGASEVWPVHEEHGWIMGRVVDPFGHHWEIGKPLRPGVGE